MDVLALVDRVISVGNTLFANPAMLSAFVLFVCFMYGLQRVMVSDNPLEWWHFIASRGVDGQQYADPDKLGKMAGIVVSSWLMVLITKDGKMEATILGVYLAYVGGVAGYSAYLRARMGLPPAEPPK